LYRSTVFIPRESELKPPSAQVVLSYGIRFFRSV
jgi:hypothetical protein